MWSENSLLKDIVTQAYQQEEKVGFLEVDLLLLHNNRLVFLSDWKKLTDKQKEKYPDGLVNLLDEAAGIKGERQLNFMNFGLSFMTKALRNGLKAALQTPMRTDYISHRDILGYFASHNLTVDAKILSILNKFINLKFPPIPVVIFSPIKPNPLMKEGISCVPDSPQVASLALLEGDLGDPNQMTSTVQEILRLFQVSIAKKNAVQDMILLFAVSGGGKTKNLYDLSRKHFALFFDFYDRSLKEDVTTYFYSLESFHYNANKINWDAFGETGVDHATNFLVSCRLLTLLLLLSIGTITTPREWLYLQLNSYIYKVIDHVGSEILNEYSLNDLFDLNKQLLAAIETITKMKCIIILDEARVLLKKMENCFKNKTILNSQTGNHQFAESKDHNYCRPLLSPLISSLSRLDAFIVMATNDTRSKEIIDEIVASNFLKANVASQKLEVIKCFNVFVPKKSEQYFGFIFKNPKEINGINEIARELCGRPRFLAAFLELLANYLTQIDSNANIQSLFNRYCQYVTGDAPADQSFVTACNSFIPDVPMRVLLDRFKSQESKMWKEVLVSICYFYFVKSGYWTDISNGQGKFDGMQAIASSICYLETKSTSRGIQHTDFHVNEKLLVRAIMYYLRNPGEGQAMEDKIDSVAEYYFCKEIARYHNKNTTLGSLLDEVVAWRFCEVKGKFSELPLFNEIPLAHGLSESSVQSLLPTSYFDISRVKDLSYSQLDIQLSQQEDIGNTPKNIVDCFKSWDKYLSRAILPDVQIGFDIAIFFDSVLILVANALRSLKVEGIKLLNNLRTTNPLLFYHTRPESVNSTPVLMNGYESKYQELMKILGERFQCGKLKSIIRIHLALPASVKSRISQVQGHQYVISKDVLNLKWKNEGKQDNVMIPSLLVDLSQETIEQSGFFSKALLQLLEEKTNEFLGNNSKRRISDKDEETEKVSTESPLKKQK